MLKRGDLFLKHQALLAGGVAVATAVVIGLLLFSLHGCSRSAVDSNPNNHTGANSSAATTMPDATFTDGTSNSTTATTVPASNPETEGSTGPTGPTKPQPLEHNVIPNHLREEDFTYDENGFMKCLSEPYWLGIDVSFHQGSIDWEQVADAGIQFAIVRIAYRGWGSAGIMKEDTWATVNLNGAAAAGLKVGVYFYSQAITVEEAREEARYVLQLLDGRELDMPVVFDWETPAADGARTENLDSETLNACAMAFCGIIEDAGYRPMVYFNQKQAKYMYDLTALQKAGYDFWLAMYEDALTYAHRVQMWQYTSHGKVPGIDGRVDMDLYFPNL